jgi:hypothetical protein
VPRIARSPSQLNPENPTCQLHCEQTEPGEYPFTEPDEYPFTEPGEYPFTEPGEYPFIVQR